MDNCFHALCEIKQEFRKEYLCINCFNIQQYCKIDFLQICNHDCIHFAYPLLLKQKKNPKNIGILSIFIEYKFELTSSFVFI